MEKYYKVTSKVTSRRAYLFYDGEIEAEKKPEPTFKSLEYYDIYVDYFDTEKDAMDFIHDNKEKYK